MTRLSKDADFTCFDTVGLPAEQQALLPEAALHTSSVRIEPFVVLVLVVVLVVLVLVAAAVGVVLVVLVVVVVVVAVVVLASKVRIEPFVAQVAVLQHNMVKVPPLTALQLAPCASSARRWRLRAARHSQSEARPLGAPPRPRGLKRAASKVADFASFDRLGSTRRRPLLSATVAQTRCLKRCSPRRRLSAARWGPTSPQTPRACTAPAAASWRRAGLRGWARRCAKC